ncbi:MAG: ketosteroid isomerase [Methylobacterium sp.]|nr:MAG: ketosteroid isomerase [Methylobacterium sp.]
MTDTKETAEAFTALLREGKHIEAATQYNAPDIVSIEAMDGPMTVARGTAELKIKSDWWYSHHEVHGGTVQGPFVAKDQFLVEFELDFTIKATGQRIQSKEWGVYTVRDGKISEERFFYPTMA